MAPSTGLAGARGQWYQQWHPEESVPWPIWISPRLPAVSQVPQNSHNSGSHPKVSFSSSF